ncbi:MAG: pimeloyl-ACP methyl esterase BioG family protein [Parabacteroides sp.]
MKIEKQINSSYSRLLLFFAGWSASPESFTGLKAENGTDIMLCYDYRDMTFHEDLSSYKEIHLIAWSMGVRMAELALAGKHALTTATAINGTPRPIDDNFGIPENIFRGNTRQPDSRRHETFQPTNVRQPGYTRTIRGISCPPAGRG